MIGGVPESAKDGVVGRLQNEGMHVEKHKDIQGAAPFSVHVADF